MKNTLECMYCGNEFDQIDMHYYNDDDELTLCTNCIQYYIECADCNRYVLQDECHHTSHGIICENCADDLVSCIHCDDLLYEDEIYSCQGESYCESCFNNLTNICSSCDESFLTDDMQQHNDYYYCETCFNDIFTCCDNCGETIYNDDAYCNDNGVFCSSCFQDEEENNIIHEHNYTPCAEFYGDDAKELHIGLEYEVYNEGDDYMDISVAEALKESFPDFFYFKKDSSVNNGGGGFEIVSHPCTLQYHQKKINYEKLTETLKSHGFSSDTKTGNCGVHVHIDRNWIERNCSKMTSVKYGLFFLNIKKFAEILARRSGSHWARFDCIERNYYKTLAKSVKPYYHDKYSAINYCHSDTIETRIFAGTIRAYRLLTAMELCHAVVNHVNNIGYTHICQKQDYTLWTEFTDYVKKNTRLYGNLLRSMNEFNMIGA